MVLRILLSPNGITSYEMIVITKNLEFYILNYFTFSFGHLAVWALVISQKHFT